MGKYMEHIWKIYGYDDDELVKGGWTMAPSMIYGADRLSYRIFGHVDGNMLAKCSLPHHAG